ncbi:MAG: TRAP-type C4-dicarboxylate transport system, small permease component [Candidatus Accumulibacter appositus]|uniref:TRAP transporter small permease protein n=1 Tax=Candidatus Accumulibacter appositus TaxID=1454003 RepID=A0A011PQ72_9PROT|nr:TRAP transporter small permease [Accumulibacter sp.]EXI79005.1 MAG: TRAP-type C4-dicarboxylate transport system, small permease component [Candidatus Accumulibacter appositus]HRF03240.1 TRAP transporter small permease [Accumulibacter sp.]
MNKFANPIYRVLLALACLSMVAALMSVMLGIIGRQIDWNLPGLDAYAGYSIAAALFLALPAAFKHGDHIRVTLVLQWLSPRVRGVFEYGCLAVGLLLAAYLCWFSVNLVWVSYTLHDVSPAADVTPMWIPQLSMAIGCAGFLLAFVHALVARWQGQEFFDAVHAEGERAQ